MGLNLSKVNFTYNRPKKNQKVRFVLKDINLSIDLQDEFICIVGHTGSGKSTLVQLMNALLIATSGNVQIGDTIVNAKADVKLKPIRKKVGLVFQFPEYQLFEETVLKDIAFGPKNFGLKEDDATLKAIEVAKTIGIDEDLLQKSPFALSGGQMRKVAIAGILASNPDVLILDEPTVGLDPFGKSELLKLLKRINEEEHKTIIVITHNMEVVSEAASRVIVLDDGCIVFDGKKTDLFRNEDILIKHNLDYPEIIKLLKQVKEKMKLDIDIYKYNLEDAYLEIVKALRNMGEKHGR